MSLSEIVRDYIERILSDQKEMKVLVLDDETTSIVSLVISQSTILEREVFLVEKIDSSILTDPSRETEKLTHMSAIYIVRPTDENITKLGQALENPKYGSYYIYFTNTVRMDVLRRLANADRNDLVKQVYEIYCDFYVVNPNLFSLNQPNTICLLKPMPSYQSIELTTFNRIVDGIFSVLMSLRKFPVIRYQRTSPICASIADKLHGKLREDPDLMSYFTQRSTTGHKQTIDGVDQSTMLLLIDRREDPVTPLLHQWTYQAMLHELLGIEQNRVRLKRSEEVKDEMKNIPLSVEQDKFYEENIYQNFGELAINIQTYVDHYQQARQRTSKIESIEDMKKFIEGYPEFSQMAGNVSKHVTLTSELDNTIKGRSLLEVSEVEQDIACNENRSEHFRQVTEVLRNPNFNNLDKIKLVILYALRYENDDKVEQMKRELSEIGVRPQQIELIPAMIEYAGASVRTFDLFNNKSLVARARSKFQTVMKGVPNVFTQHQPLLSNILEEVIKGKLKENDFPGTTKFNPKERLRKVIVFMTGGATFEEAKEVSELNKRLQDMEIVLGGTHIHNSKSFLAEVYQLILSRNMA